MIQKGLQVCAMTSQSEPNNTDGEDELGLPSSISLSAVWDSDLESYTANGRLVDQEDEDEENERLDQDSDDAGLWDDAEMSDSAEDEEKEELSE